MKCAQIVCLSKKRFGTNHKECGMFCYLHFKKGFIFFSIYMKYNLGIAINAFLHSPNDLWVASTCRSAYSSSPLPTSVLLGSK